VAEDVGLTTIFYQVKESLFCRRGQTKGQARAGPDADGAGSRRQSDECGLFVLYVCAIAP
jgi:hypothetical protein